MIPRAKKKKQTKPQRKPPDYVRESNYLNMAIVFRTLWTVYGWRSKRIADFLGAYLALMAEVADNRTSVWQQVKDCKDLTGIDVKQLLDDLEKGGKQ